MRFGEKEEAYLLFSHIYEMIIPSVTDEVDSLRSERRYWKNWRAGVLPSKWNFQSYVLPLLWQESSGKNEL